MDQKETPLKRGVGPTILSSGDYNLVNSMKNRFKNQIVIDIPGGLNHLDFNNTRHASPLDAHLGGFFCLESNMMVS